LKISPSFNVARHFYVSLFFLLSHLNVYAQTTPFNFNTNEQAAYFALLDLDFTRARNQLQQLPGTSPAAIYIANLTDVTEIYISEDPALYEKYKSNEDLRLETMESLDDHQPEKRFLECEIKLHWAFAALKFGNEWAAFWNLRQAYHAIAANQEQFPGFLPNQKSMGVLLTLFDAFPDRYQWILNLFGLPGSSIVGVEKLQNVQANHPVFNIESKIYIAVFNAFLFNKSNEAVQALRDLQAEYNLNAANFILSLSLIKDAQSRAAQLLLTELTDVIPDRHHPHLLNYYLAETHLQAADYHQAIAEYKRFVNGFHGRSLKKDAYLKIAICYWIMQDGRYQQYLSLARSIETTQSEADKHAQKMLEKDHLPHRVLLGIRYATDGGFYSKAESLITRYPLKSFVNKHDQTEYLYRRARLHHKTSSLSQAEHYYLRAIDLQEGSSWYFAPNACLQLGYIYREKGKPREAMAYFKKALTYKHYPYESSIRKKAGLAIKLLPEID